MIGRVGIVHSILQYRPSPDQRFYFSPDVLVKVCKYDESFELNCIYLYVRSLSLLYSYIQVTVPVFQGGDVVKIIDVKTSVQVLHGIWDDTMIEVKHCKL